MIPLCTLMRQLPVRARKHDFATKPNNSIEQPSRNTRSCRYHPRIRQSCHAPSPIFVCPSIDGGKRDVDSLAGIESLEMLLAIPHSIAAAPTETWVRQDASGWSGGGRREEGGEGLQSHPTSPTPITQAEKKFFFFFSEPASSKLNRHLVLVTRNG
jgi:hypothetical protein